MDEMEWTNTWTRWAIRSWPSAFSTYSVIKTAIYGLFCVCCGAVDDDEDAVPADDDDGGGQDVSIGETMSVPTDQHNGVGAKKKQRSC